MYCFGMLSSKGSLDQRADPIWHGQNNKRCSLG